MAWLFLVFFLDQCTMSFMEKKYKMSLWLVCASQDWYQKSQKIKQKMQHTFIKVTSAYISNGLLYIKEFEYLCGSNGEVVAPGYRTKLWLGSTFFAKLFKRIPDLESREKFTLIRRKMAKQKVPEKKKVVVVEEEEDDVEEEEEQKEDSEVGEEEEEEGENEVEYVK